MFARDERKALVLSLVIIFLVVILHLILPTTVALETHRTGRDEGTTHMSTADRGCREAIINVRLHRARLCWQIARPNET